MQEVFNLKTKEIQLQFIIKTTRFYTDVHRNGQTQVARGHLSSLKETGSILDTAMESHHKDTS